MQTIVLALALGCASAFAPVQQAAKATAVKALVDEFEVGVQPPAGFFDPLNYCEDQPESFARRRAVERKHGRISMVAMTGILVRAGAAGKRDWTARTRDSYMGTSAYSRCTTPTLSSPATSRRRSRSSSRTSPTASTASPRCPRLGCCRSSSSRGSSSWPGGPLPTTRATTTAASSAKSTRARRR
mmetsp:Transcript_8221/g.29116  ORF Transcript_8221/g.29116 Transcript_8221/m.29116 type:complete len:185 (+) Transcript_8221:56-610(+)